MICNTGFELQRRGLIGNWASLILFTTALIAIFAVSPKYDIDWKQDNYDLKLQFAPGATVIESDISGSST